MKKKLFIPGPVDVSDDVLEKMSCPMIGHRSKSASELQCNITKKLQQLMYTNNPILLSTSSGSGLMEGAIRSCTIKRAAVFSIGAFGERWYKMAISNGVPADIFRSELGHHTDIKMLEMALSSGKYDLITITHNETSTGVMNPIEEISGVIKKYPEIIFCLDTVSSMGGTKIEVDNLGVDICITSSQKCLGLPPGISFCSISEKAIKAAEKVPNRGLYFDLLELYKYVINRDHQYPSTPSIPHMYALDYQLDKILAEGLDARFDRHVSMANCVRSWAKDHFELFANERYLSNTLTTVKNIKDISVTDLNLELSKHGFEISNGYGVLKEKTFRIAHMADTTLDDINLLLCTINEILRL